MLPDQADTLYADAKSRAQKLQPYEQCLKQFKYREALNQALATKNPEVILALFEELVERGGLESSLAGRSPDGLLQLGDFLAWKLADHRYQSLLVEVARIVLDMYSGPLLLANAPESARFLKDLGQVVDRDVQVQTDLKQIGGQLDLLFRLAASSSS